MNFLLLHKEIKNYKEQKGMVGMKRLKNIFISLVMIGIVYVVMSNTVT